MGICNYVFDTLVQDAFRRAPAHSRLPHRRRLNVLLTTAALGGVRRIMGGELQEALCTVMSDRPEPDPLHPVRAMAGGGHQFA